jgi:hypothetical protein
MTAEAQQEIFLLGVKGENDSSEIQYAGFTEDITNVEYGKKDFDQIVLINGGRIKKFLPQDTGEFTIKCYPLGVARDANGSMALFSGTVPASDPYKVINNYKHENARLVFLWAETLPGTASAATTSANGYAERLTVINANEVEVKPDYSDKIKSCEVTFKWNPFMKSGTANCCYESTYGTGLSAVTATSTSPNGQW